MDIAVVRQFLNFFEDFINLCHWKNWPNNETTEAEFKNAFLVSHHIEKSMDRFQKKSLLNEFLSSLNSKQKASDDFLKNCLSNPPKYILKKIINSDTSISHMDVAFKVFLEQFSDKKLENYLTDIMLEMASKDTLLKNMAVELSRERIVKFKSQLILCQLNIESKDCIQDMLNNCNEDTIELLVVSLCNTDSKYQPAVNIVSECFLEILLSKDNRYKKFWKLLFNVDEKYLIKMCVEKSDLYSYMCEALMNCGKLLAENMSAEYFYIEFTYSELASIVCKLNQNKFLKSQFVDIVQNHNVDSVFWTNILS